MPVFSEALQDVSDDPSLAHRPPEGVPVLGVGLVYPQGLEQQEIR